MLCGQPKTTAGPHDELRMEFEDKKQELYNLCVEMRSVGAIKILSWEDWQTLRLTTLLAAQVEPEPDDRSWYINLQHMHTYAPFVSVSNSFSYVACRRMYRWFRRLYDYQTTYYCLGFLAYSLLGKDKKKDEEKNEDKVPAKQ